MSSVRTNKLKIFNDPIYGFISIPKPIIFDLIEHPLFQRLRRITQMGLSYLVYPGAQHSRFHHAIGCVHLMNKAINVLRNKGVVLDDNEETALYIAILLHDIGHGPFSHALEHSLISEIHHEDISLKFMEYLNIEFEGKLDLAIEIFKGEYSRDFLYQLVSSQLDIDRLDYLKRDGFYTGVVEGSINSDRLISMMNVVDDQLVIEEKGIYSIEKFIVARRLMYWQVYLHKTGVVAENMLVNLLRRAKELIANGQNIGGSKELNFFLKHNISRDKFDDEILIKFSKLDDIDVLSSIKVWSEDQDYVLSHLSKSILNRKLLRINFQNQPVEDQVFERERIACMQSLNLSENEVEYLVFRGEVKNLAYNNINGRISLLKKDQTLVDFASASDQMVAQSISKETVKHFLAFPK